MALIVEDGTGRADAESYVSVSEASSYFEKRGLIDAWGDVDDQEAALRKASDYLGATYRLMWSGKRVSATQALDWPRTGVRRSDFDGYYAEDAVPSEVVRACAELALRAGSGTDLLSDVERLTKSESVGPISVTYADGASPQLKFEAVDRLLAPLIGGRGPNVIKVVRS